MHIGTRQLYQQYSLQSRNRWYNTICLIFTRTSPYKPTLSALHVKTTKKRFMGAFRGQLFEISFARTQCFRASGRCPTYRSDGHFCAATQGLEPCQHLRTGSINPFETYDSEPKRELLWTTLSVRFRGLDPRNSVPERCSAPKPKPCVRI